MRSSMRVFVLGTVLCLTMAGAALACTSVMVGKKATADGSVLVSYTCDGWYDARLDIRHGGKHKKGEMVPVYKNVCYQTKPNTPLVKVGEIPQVEETYTYFHLG